MKLEEVEIYVHSEKNSMGYVIQCNPLIWNGSGPPLYPEKPYKRDSPIPIPIHTQESGPGDRTLYTDIPCI